MAIYIEGNKKIKNIFANMNGEKKSISSAWVNKDGVPTKVFSANKSISKIASWTNGTDEEIAAMLEAHYNGDIDIYDYWKVGDERMVSLSAMGKGNVGETHVAQTQTFVLMNAGGKTLETAINGKTECAFIVGQKNILANGAKSEIGYMNSSSNNTGGWDKCARRTWCNSTYAEALPTKFRSLFKKFNNVTASGNGAEKTTSVDKFALPSEKEVLGNVNYANLAAETDNKQFEYYKTFDNQIKKNGNNNSVNSYWTRSPGSSNRISFCYIYKGNSNTTGAIGTYGIAPFGCI